MAGLQTAAQQLASYGRGPDNMLAHISADEAKFIDQIQGGRRTNPMTGLPEYGLFGKILKAVVRVGAGIGGFMIGGPAGAAAGSAAATKLTGGSWKQALKAGAMAGVGSYAGQGLSGGGWGLTGSSGAATAGTGTLTGSSGLNASLTSEVGQSGLGASPGFYSGLSNAGTAASGTAGASGLGGLSSATAAAAPSAASGLGAALAPIGGYGGAGAGLGSLSVPLSRDNDDSAPLPLGNNINLNVKPFHRQYQAYQDDATKFGEQPGGWQFFDEVNPEPELKARGGAIRGYALGGPTGPGMPGAGIGGMGGLRNLGIPSQLETPHFQDPGAMRSMAQDMSPGAQRAKLRQAAIIGYVNAKDGGAINGPGTGTSDSVPAMLSDGEHVIDQQTVNMLGGGSNARGHKAIERFKQKARARAGVKNPKKPPAFQGKK